MTPISCRTHRQPVLTRVVSSGRWVELTPGAQRVVAPELNRQSCRNGTTRVAESAGRRGRPGDPQVSARRFDLATPDTFRFLQRRPTEVILSDIAARAVRDTRGARAWTQAQLATRAGVSRSLVSKVECGRRPVSMATIAAIADALNMRVELTLRPPFIAAPILARDVVHGRCVVYVERRLVRMGWEVAREALIDGAGGPGWVDVLAFNRRSAALLVIEVKTQIHDIGGIERTLAWYEQAANSAARARGWRHRSVAVALLCLDSREVADTLRGSRPVAEAAFPVGAHAFAAWLADPASTSPLPGRALALVDPRRRGAAWLIGARSGGRRRQPGYDGYADAAGRLASVPRRRRAGRAA